jgi:hypothetical protein
MREDTNQPNLFDVMRFLSATHDNNAPFHLVAISAQGKVDAKTFQPNNKDQMPDWLSERNGIDNIYFSVNRIKEGVVDRKAKKSDINSATCLHVDVDDIDALERIKAFQPKPTAIVFSGGGYQAFWLLKKDSEELERIEYLNQVIAQLLGGDNCHNIDRIMRLPGTINVPNDKKRAAGRTRSLAYLVEEGTDWSLRYEVDDFNEIATQLKLTKTALVPTEIIPLRLERLPKNVSVEVRDLILNGDDLTRPISSPNAHFKSRSEAVFKVSCELARAKCKIDEIAGILINPDYGISCSVLEKKRPQEYAFRQADRAIAVTSTGWPDVTKEGYPKPTLRNTMLAMTRLGLDFAFDQFRFRKTVQGLEIQEYQGDLSDDVCAALRHEIIEKFGFDPYKENSRDAAQTLSLQNPFHPILEYLNGLNWDGRQRIDGWLHTYLGAENTELNSVIGTIVLIAAVRRIREPGTKFDTILVLEGTQGGGKSTAIRILAGEKNFSDQEILSLDPKTQMEALEGVWVYEIAELEGISRSDTGKVKAFASRSIDQGRPAYARFKEKRPRQVVFIGTTNDDKYLRDTTGNRRFWPVKVGTINLELLAIDRDQLWAEAASKEAKGYSLVLPQELWPLAQKEQDARLEDDPWLDSLSTITPQNCDRVEGYIRISSKTLLFDFLHVPTERQQQYHLKRLAGLMRKLGWEGPRPLRMADGTTTRAYQRAEPDYTSF